MNRTLEELGAELKASRLSHGLSVNAVAGLSCVRPQYIECIESADFPDDWTLMHARSQVRNYINAIHREDLWPEYERELSPHPPSRAQAMPDPTEEEMRHFAPIDPFGAPERHESAPAAPADPEPELPVPERPRRPVSAYEAARGDICEEPEEVTAAGVSRRTLRFDQMGPAMGSRRSEEPDRPAVSAPPRRRRVPSFDNVEEAGAVREPVAADLGEPAVPSRRGRPVKEPQPLEKVERSRPAGRTNRAPRSDSPLLAEELEKEERHHRGSPWAVWVMFLITLAVMVLLGWLVWRGAHRLFTPAGETTNRPAAATEDLGALVVSVPKVSPAEGGADSPAAGDVPSVPVVSGSDSNTAVAQPAADKPVVETPERAQSDADGGQKGKLVIRIQGGECWVLVRKGERNIYGKVMKSGESQAFDLDADLLVKYGAAQHATTSVDGAPFSEPGKGVLNKTYKAVR